MPRVEAAITRDPEHTPSFVVVVPTWKRPDYVRRALEAIAGQSYRPVAILPVARIDDVPTWDVFRDMSNSLSMRGISLSPIEVKRPGFLAPLVAAQHALQSRAEDIVAIFDDDCEPDQTFLERVAGLYRDPGVAGVGGRCISFYRGERLPMAPSRLIGHVDWLGRAYGGMTAEPSVPGVREVDFIMGGAGTYRRAFFCSFRFPREMDRDVAYAYEQFLGSQARKLGRLLYDPSAAVVHHTAEREAIGMRPVDVSDEAQRTLGVRARAAGAWNSAFALWNGVHGFKRVVVCLSFLLIGSSEFPGPIYRLLKPWRRSLLSWRSAMREKIDGFRCAALHRWTALTIDDVR